MTVEPVIKGYYEHWLKGDREAARTALADDLTFRSPADNFDSADAFIDKCWHLSEQFNAMDVVHEVYDDGSGYLVYRTGDFCCGEYHKVREGKISEIYVTFNPTI